MAASTGATRRALPGRPASGIAYWLLPRRRSPGRPLGDDERLAFGAVAALNLGLLLRALSEPAERGGGGGNWTIATLIVSAVLQGWRHER